MGIDKESSGYTFGFAIAMVIVVGAVLSIAAMALKPAQQKNEKEEKMQSILMAVQVEVERSESQASFDKYITEQIVLNADGEVKEGDITAFKVDVKKEYKSLPFEERNYPLYVAEKEGKKYYVIPMVGTGLWGPIWGFVALESDQNTVYGAIFDHKTETPGLGAEIKEPFFEDQFPGEKINNENGKFVSIEVIKGTSSPENKHAVDGITGGTITSVGVSKMLERTLKVYAKYFEKNKNS